MYFNVSIYQVIYDVLHVYIVVYRQFYAFRHTHTHTHARTHELRSELRMPRRYGTTDADIIVLARLRVRAPCNYPCPDVGVFCVALACVNNNVRLVWLKSSSSIHDVDAWDLCVDRVRFLTTGCSDMMRWYIGHLFIYLLFESDHIDPYKNITERKTKQ